jgi:predicted PurR-regulated permease PerM
MNADYPPPYTKKPLPSPNPVTRAEHRREVNRQVILPFIISLIVFVGFGIWLAWMGIGSVERWSQIAIIFMLVWGLVLGLIFLIIIIGLMYVTTMVLRTIPPYARIAQDAIEKINQQVKTGSNVSVRPVIEIQKFLAVMDVVLGRRKI